MYDTNTLYIYIYIYVQNIAKLQRRFHNVSTTDSFQLTLRLNVSPSIRAQNTDNCRSFSRDLHIYVFNTLLPAHLSKNSRSSFRAASLRMFKLTLP